MEMHDGILRMGVLVEEALQKLLFALEMKDFVLAEEVVEDDRRIDAMEVSIDDLCARIIAVEQPDARDLRDVLMTLKITSALERIGDHARHIARNARVITETTFITLLPLIRKMAEKDISMLHDFLTSYVDQDADRAMEVAARDDEVDILHAEFSEKLVEILRNYPAEVDKGLQLMLVNRFLERFGDHVTNMCEWVVFLRYADHVELNK